VPAQNKLSIVIPVFNEASTVLALLNRVWDQEISMAKEMVIVESNSRDNTRDIVVRFAKEKNDRQAPSPWFCKNPPRERVMRFAQVS
jgi:glycosyltransferase involved in cell wall biosynthesis